MTPGALRLSAPREELPSRPIGEFESCRSSWLSLLSPLIFPSSSSRSGLSPAFAREWLFYLGTVELDASHRKLLFMPAPGAEGLIRMIPNTRIRGETHNLRALRLARYASELECTLRRDAPGVEPLQVR